MELEETIHEAIIAALGDLADYTSASTLSAAAVIAAEIRETVVADALFALEIGH